MNQGANRPGQLDNVHKPLTVIQLPLQRVATENAKLRQNQVISGAHEAYCRGQHRIAAMSSSGNRAKKEVRRFLLDRKVRLSAALKQMGGVSPDLSEALTLCDRINPWLRDDAPVVWHFKPKPKGGHRVICKLPPKMKAVHRMLRDAIAAQLPRDELLYGIPGSGRDDAARALKACQNAGFSCLAHVDIVDCFQRVNPDALYELPLPKEVIHQQLDTRNIRFTGIPYGTLSNTSPLGSIWNALNGFLHTTTHRPNGPTGLMQGSPASSAILAWLLRDIPRSDDTVVLLCFDNIAVAGQTWMATERALTAIALHLARSPAGPFDLCAPTYSGSEPLEFLGYLFNSEREDIGIAPGALRRMELKLLAIEERHATSLIRDPLFYYEIWSALLRFRAGFSAAQHDGSELNYLLETTLDTIAPYVPDSTLELHNLLFSPEGKRFRDVIERFIHNRR
ncbi:hypothetical protein O5O51_03330 [Sinirhodobacter sp. HNIBRBA609]|nr:hypothetical protein O5O51_03330 [Sinirhodobacter sp. HNIBRBA609]